MEVSTKTIKSCITEGMVGKPQNKILYHPDHTLHRIKTDILLVALGGFAPIVSYHRDTRAYSPEQIRRLVAFCLKFKNRPVEPGETPKIASSLNISTSSVAVAVWKLRNGKMPEYWNAVLAGFTQS
jgi:hypothetical protein